MNSLPPRRYITTVCALIAERLNEYGMSIPPEAVESFVRSHIESAAAQYDTDKREAVKRFPEASEYASSVAVALLTSIAEERPGANPWLDHDGTIPLAVEDLVTVMASTAIAAELAHYNEAYDLVGAFLALSADMTIWFQRQIVNKSHMQPFLFAPQPGLAFCVRMLRTAGQEVMSGAWDLQEENGSASPADIAFRFWSDADSLENLKKDYGISPHPSDQS